jgi:aromatic-L-amino-acid/L-tryptophan decarboxylase
MLDLPPSGVLLHPEALRRLGYRAIDAIVERHAQLDRMPVAAPATGAELREPLPEHGADPALVLETVLHDVLAPGLRIDHPRFLAFAAGLADPVGALGDLLVSGFSTQTAVWMASPGAATIELVVLDWLREAFGMPEPTEGVFVSGGSAANLSALAVALEERAGAERARATVYLSEETHWSVAKALRMLGVAPDHVRTLPCDGRERLVPDAVLAAVAADRAAGRLPVCVIATAGTIGTGAVDPLPELREVCDAEGLWLHVDGALGAPAALTARGRAQLRGLELGDSLVVDPHKWLFQPPGAGCLLVRDGAALERTFRATPTLLRDVRTGEVDFADRGIELTRRCRALKVWMSLKIHGAAAFRAAIDHGLDLAEHAQAVLARTPGWEIVTPAQLGVVTFRAVRGGGDPDALHARLSAAALQDGFAFVNTTRVRGMTALRLCTINPRTTREDIERTIEALGRLGLQPALGT